MAKTVGGKQSGFKSYVVFTDEDGNVDPVAGQAQKEETTTDGFSATDSVDKDWEFVAALNHLPPLNLPRLSYLNQMEDVVPTEDHEDEGASEVKLRQPSTDNRKLCGFLRKYKLGGRGLTKIFKRRWFVFADSTCNLIYYRTPQDLIPLGEINISHATFTFDLQTERSTNVFEIRVHNKTYWLEADDRNTMLYWLQELQLRRRQFRCRISSKPPEVNVGYGLVDFGEGCQVGTSPDGSSDQEPALMHNISLPQKTVGPTSAAAAGGKTAIKDLSITNLRVEFRNMISNFRSSRHSKSFNGHVLGQNPMSSSLDESADVCVSSYQQPQNKAKFPGVSEKLQSFKSRLVGLKMTSIPEVQGKSNCLKCRQLQECLKSYQDEMLMILEELTATREILKASEKEVQKLEAERDIYMEATDRCPDLEHLRDLSDKAHAMVELQSLIGELSEKLVEFESQNRLLKAELHSLKDDQSMYQDNIELKDQVVVNMTSRIAELEQAVGTQISRRNSATNTTLMLVNMSPHLDQLQDKCEAFELQNKFLNQEIHELNLLLEQEEAKGDSYQVQLTQAEAQIYELKSKYIYVLQEVSKPHYGMPESSTHEMVTQLLQDAIDSDKSFSRNSGSENLRFTAEPYDQYGFGLQFCIEGNDLGSVADSLHQRSEQLKARRLNSDMLLAMKWEKFLISMADRPPQRSKELKLLLREGLSPRFRGEIWRMCIGFTVGEIRSHCGSEYYKNLLDKGNSYPTISPIRHQIELDLLRTLPNNRYYECYDSDGIPRLKNILLAYSIHNPSVGYCQGLNRLAAILLLFLEEEDSFWGLVSIIEHLMPTRYYDHTLIAAHADQRVLKEVISEKLPCIHSHFLALGFDVSLFTFNWFLAIFVDNIPVEIYLRIWDSFIYEGSKVLFRYSVAVLKFCEDSILSKKDSADLHAYMRSLGDVMTDINRISQIAFNGINPFSMKMVNAKRQFHLQKLEVELKELDRLREQFQNSLQSLGHNNSDEETY